MTATSTPPVLVTAQEGILRIQLHRPDKKNAITADMYMTLTEAIQQAEQDPAIRVLLLTGTEDCFSSGNDLADFINNSAVVIEDSPVFHFLLAISQAAKPIVASVGGLAVGIGVTLLLHCDLVYASTNALFRLPFTNLGLCPEGGSSLLLPLRIGYQRAAELLLLGEPFSATKALEIGLINGIYNVYELNEAVWQKAQQLATQPVASMLLTKSLLKRNQAALLREVLLLETHYFVERLHSPEAAQALKAFMARKKTG
jgi:enoyl-CoA hydratase/carnithine racemase